MSINKKNNFNWIYIRKYLIFNVLSDITILVTIAVLKFSDILLILPTLFKILYIFIWILVGYIFGRYSDNSFKSYLDMIFIEFIGIIKFFITIIFLHNIIFSTFLNSYNLTFYSFINFYLISTSFSSPLIILLKI